MANTSTRTLTCVHLIGGPDGTPCRAQQITLAGDTIASVGAATTALEPLLALPVLVNAHDHGRAVRTSSIGAAGKPLESWLHHLALMPSVDPYLAAVVAFGNSARGGAGVVMTHYTRTQGFTDLPTEAAEVARAARDVGVRVGFAVSMKDCNPLVYGASEPVLAALPADARAEIARRFIRPALTPHEQIELVDAVAEAAGSENFDVQYGPNGVQWCSKPLLEAISEASQRTGRRVHMHLLETRYQRAWLDAAYPDGALRFLDQIGLLSPRLTVAHGVWARPDELSLLAERGVTISVNTASNLHLRSGIAPAVRMMQSGCRIALGIDGRALDDDDDALRDLRLAQLLHAGTGFATGISPRDMLRAAFAGGRFAVTNVADGGGTIAAGAPADLLLLDWAALDDDCLRDDLDPVDLLISRATARHIREVIVGGRSIVRDGRVLGLDHDAARREVLAQMRAGMARNAMLAAVLPALERAIADWFAEEHPCC
jgi:cytosine/adenosine deaminase-related metal-dependent hydrolase